MKIIVYLGLEGHPLMCQLHSFKLEAIDLGWEGSNYFSGVSVLVLEKIMARDRFFRILKSCLWPFIYFLRVRIVRPMYWTDSGDTRVGKLVDRVIAVTTSYILGKGSDGTSEEKA